MTDVPATMRAAVVRRWASPPCFAIEQVPTPVPSPGELVFRVHTAAINFGDTLIASGGYQVRPDLPFVAGTEASGTVVAVGEGVSGFAPGDRIAACGFVGDARADRRIVGAFAEYAMVKPANAVHLAGGVPLEQGALFRSNMETSAFALYKGRLQAGETLLVLGASGGTGHAAVQLGKLAGARVIASASSEAKRAIALAAGADVAIDSGDPEWRGRVDALTGGRGLDVVYDPVGGLATERAFRALAWDGRLLVVGFAAGAIPSIPANLPLLKGASLIGANLLQGLKYEPEHCAREAVRLMDLFGQGRLSVPPVARRYPLEELDAALADSASGRTAGRVVITIGEEREAVR
ncbi:NADPH:quinone oxidoreductase family protein [Flavisphingomonas formosensis]|uniref:NADPH:quinone oxidoreductase family protein n=1 Tax=Flavisphingomonas formosensis TaxID=861534 RepID=UPI0012F7B72A|nr:NADPH:quinone oxidoreductase family protein [Sphingomonas formosensis]